MSEENSFLFTNYHTFLHELPKNGPQQDMPKQTLLKYLNKISKIAQKITNE